MANNKVQLADGTTLIDLTDTTAVAEDVAAGKYFYNAAGVKTLGTGSSGGGTPPRMIDHAEVTFASTATSSNKVTVNLTPATNCVLAVFADELPAAPDSSEYISLAWFCFYSSYGTATAVAAILRPAGTIGSDGSMASFNKSTGKLTLGGQYGHYMAGTKYQIYEFKMG